MSIIPHIEIEITIALGDTHMPINQLLKMGRGAVIALDAKYSDPVDIFANGELIARGQIVVNGDKVSVEVIERVKRSQALELHFPN